MKFSVRTLLIIVGAAAIFFAIYTKLIVPVREAARITTCQNNLRQIALAIMNYDSAFGRLPVSAESGPDGQLWHSWRSQVYPDFMEQTPKIYDSGKPWNSPTNLRLLNGAPVGMSEKGGTNPRMVSLDASPWALCCPSNEKECELHSQISYVVVSGLKTAFPPDKSVTFMEMTDGSENTILVVESLNTAIQWTEPRDLHIDSMSFKINDPNQPSISSHHPGGANVVFADGEAFFMTNDITGNELKGLLTIAGGEEITRADLVERGILK